jgi:hypothetical protein
MAIRRAPYKPPTLKEYRDAAARYFELLASGMEREKALHEAGAKYRAKPAANQMLGLESFAEWRLLHLVEDWQEPPYGWMNPAELRRMSDKRARWLWVNMQGNAAIAERAQALDVHPMDLRSEYSNNGEWEKLRAEIEAQYPDEAVCKELLTQHHNAIAGIEAPKQLPMPPLLIEVAVTQRDLVSVSPA